MERWKTIERVPAPALVPSYGGLTGMRVLMTGSVVSAPFAATILAEHGAEVIHVERPGFGDPFRGQAPVITNGNGGGKPFRLAGPEVPALDKVSTGWIQDARNKLSLTLEVNLRIPEAKDIFLSLIKNCDVWLENMVWTEKLGITEQMLFDVNPKLVIAHISGFGRPQFGGVPEECDRPSYDAIGQAEGGWMHLNGWPDMPKLLKEQMDSGKQWDLTTGDVDESRLEQVENRLYGACLGAAAALVSEGVASIEDTDRGAKVGLRWKRGPFELMNRIGIERAYKMVHAMTERHSDFKMPEILIKQRELGKPFELNYVDLDVQDGIAFITINRPEAMNALNEVTVSQLAAQFAKAEENPAVKAIVLRGAGKAFVAGADVRYFVENIKKNRIPDTEVFTRKGHELFLRIENSKKLTVAVLDGLSMGGGSELALSCQAIVATPAGSLGFPETAIGIYPGLGGMLRTARQIGPDLAKYYVFTGKTITAKDAHDLGIITKLVSPQELDAAIKEVCAGSKSDKYRSRRVPARFSELAKACSQENATALLSGAKPAGVADSLAESTLKAVSRKAPLALKKANELIDQQQKLSIPEAVELELAGLTYIFSTEDALAGLSSVGGKPPKYSGK